MKLPWTTKQDLRTENSELRAEIEDLKGQVERAGKIDTAMTLISAGHQPDKSFMLELHSDVWPLIANCLHVWFKENGGKNYIEQQVDFGPQKASLGFNAGRERYILTLQRLFGKTPDQMRREVELERDVALARIKMLEGKR